MSLGEGDVKPVVEEVDVLEPAERQILDDRELVNQGQIELARAELRHRFLGIELGEVDLDVWMAVAERFDCPRRQDRARRREGAEPQPTGPKSGQGLQLLLRGVDAAEDLVRMADERPA